MTSPSTPRRALSILPTCFCALLLGCSEPEDSRRVVYCKVVVNAFAFNPSDMKYVKVDEITLPSGPRVDIELDDFNEHRAKQRHRITCDFDELELMKTIVVDGQTLISEEVRNLNVEAIGVFTEMQIERIRASR
jgi:hypothetical protein